MRIGIDIDEVLAESITAIISFHNKNYGTNLKKDDFHTYKFWEVWGGQKKRLLIKSKNYSCKQIIFQKLTP